MTMGMAMRITSTAVLNTSQKNNASRDHSIVFIAQKVDTYVVTFFGTLSLQREFLGTVGELVDRGSHDIQHRQVEISERRVA